MLTIDPGRALAGLGDRVAGRAEDRRGAAEWRPDGEAAAGEPTGGQAAVELGDAGCHLLRRSMRKRRRIGKALLEQRAETGKRGGSRRHRKNGRARPPDVGRGRETIPNKYRKQERGPPATSALPEGSADPEVPTDPGIGERRRIVQGRRPR